MKFYSQQGQDQFIFENFFRGRRNGVFVDVGARDGENFSNSLFFESSMGWRGLCVEPLASAFSKLVAHRKCISEQEPLKTLSSLLEKHGLFHVDYCSIDAEGAELSILSNLDLKRFDISVFTIGNDCDDPRLVRLMAEKGYDFVAKLGQQHVFKRRDVKRLARTTVICAVWHADPERRQLLAGHAANLLRQTIPIETVYIFDSRDEPPQSIPGRKVVVHENLSIYQAWNVGLALVDTPLVMNLNLDDRLAPDAIERLEAALLESDAALVGGDWNICYSQESTDAVEACYSAERLPFVPDWPPKPGTHTCLGSGTGRRGTFGPATMWRMDAHIGAPRYPWRLMDGTTLKVIGDAAWWAILTNHLQKKAVRLRLVVGNYHSHPDSQAEFRVPEHEFALLNEVGISLV